MRIVKTAWGKTSEEVVENGQRFDNIYGFIYRQRRAGTFVQDKDFHIHLPTRDVQFKLVAKEKFKAADREFDAYYMRSTPSDYEVWFDGGVKKIPLMISGTLGFGNTSMVMRDHSEKKR